MNIFKRKIFPYSVSFVMTFFFTISLSMNCSAFDFPAAGWHRGDAAFAQENSRAALSQALNSANPNIELDIIDFVDTKGNLVGLVSHDYLMKRSTGLDGAFGEKYNDLSKIPPNAANPQLPPQPFMTVVDLFELIKEKKAQGVTPTVSLDMKEEGKNAEAFAGWIGTMIKQYGFQDHVFASSFFLSNIEPLKTTCPECMVGGLVFNDHWGLKFLSHYYSSLDITHISKFTFFLGFLGKKEFPHDFILIQDDIFFQKPELVDYWKNKRKVKFVGVFVYNKERPYTDTEWELLQKVDWMELDPPQMKQYLQMKQIQNPI
jgi:glycerophosphoryl diester phosphodiesterase